MCRMSVIPRRAGSTGDIEMTIGRVNPKFRLEDQGITGLGEATGGLRRRVSGGDLEDLRGGHEVREAVRAQEQDIVPGKARLPDRVGARRLVAERQHEDGDIDAKRFPNFARLARSSTWYRGACGTAPRPSMPPSAPRRESIDAR